MKHLSRPSAAARLAATALLLAATALAAQADDQAIAMIDGESVLESEIQVQGELRRLEQEAFEAKLKAFDNFVANKLIEEAASREGLSGEEFFSREVVEKAEAPTDEQVEAFYEERKDQIGEPIENVRGKIVDFLQNQRREELRAELVEGLRAKRDIRVLLDPPRLPVRIDGAPSEGPVNAPVTVVEFSDFECPFCKRIQPVLAELRSRYGDRVRWVAKDLPLSAIHPQAQRAAEAARCAGDQDRSSEFRQRLFGAERLEEDSYTNFASELEMDVEAFDACLAEGRHRDSVLADASEAFQLGVQSTPTLLINGARLTERPDVEGLTRAINRELERVAQKSRADD